jgi:membrane-associated phospholipid phosphatase
LAPLDKRSNADAARSFFSGHVANTMGATLATLRTFQRLGKPALGWVMFSAGVAGSGLVGVSRVLAGSHFPSDVLIGAAMGAGIGIAVPALHEPGFAVMPIAGTDAGGLLVQGAWR